MGTCPCVHPQQNKFVFSKKVEVNNQQSLASPEVKDSKKSMDSEKISRQSTRQSNLPCENSIAVVTVETLKVPVEPTPAGSSLAQLQESMKWQSYFQTIAELTPSVIIRRGISRDQKNNKKRSEQLEQDQTLNLDFLDCKSATPSVLLDKKKLVKQRPQQKNYNVDKVLNNCRAGPLVVPYISYEKYSLS